MSVAKGRSGLQPVYHPTTLPSDTRGRSYDLPPTNPTGQTETPRVLRICNKDRENKLKATNTNHKVITGAFWLHQKGHGFFPGVVKKLLLLAG